MAITTLDGVIAGAQPPRPIMKGNSNTTVSGRPYSYWYTAGVPGPGSADTSTANGVVRSSSSSLVAGQIPHYDPGGGISSYLMRLTIITNNFGLIILADRLWDCGANSGGSALSPSSTSVQTINSATWPSRDDTGTTNGAGVQIGLEISTTMASGGTPGTTSKFNYTNSSGSGSKVANLTTTWTTNPPAGTFHFFGWQAGDVGIQSIQSIQMNASSGSSGQYIAVAWRLLQAIEQTIAVVGNSNDALTSGFPQIFNGAVPFLIFIPNGASTYMIGGSYSEAQG
jgi:hypothetical protein